MSFVDEVAWSELAPAKINLALHVRARRPDGRHDIETLFAFCTDGDRLRGYRSETLELAIDGPFADQLSPERNNLVLKAARLLADAAGVSAKADLRLTKNLPVASGIGGGSADAGATLRLLTSMWGIDPRHASDVAPSLGSDVPACLISMTARGEGAGDRLRLVPMPELAGAPVLLINPGVAVSTREIFESWDGVDHGPLDDGWKEGRNDLEPAALSLEPGIGDVLDWLRKADGAHFVRMTGSGATCFALFDSEGGRDAAASKVPAPWWHLATSLR